MGQVGSCLESWFRMRCVAASVVPVFCLAGITRGWLSYPRSNSRAIGRLRGLRKHSLVTLACAPSERASYSVSPQNGNPHRYTLIYLHGFTGGGEDYLCRDSDLIMPWRLGEAYAPCLRVLLPTAEHLQHGWGEEMPSWYSYADSESNRVGDLATLEATRDRLGYFLRSEIELLNGAGNRLFLGGCSQGCTVALDAYLREACDLRLGGFVGSIGFVPSDAEGFAGADAALERLVQDAEQAQRPVWLQCAHDDQEEVPWKLVRSSLRRMRHRVPGLLVHKVTGRGHAIGEWEASILNEFLQEHASDAYFDDANEVFAEEDEWDDEWYDLDIEIDIDVGPSIPGMNA